MLNMWHFPENDNIYHKITTMHIKLTNCLLLVISIVIFIHTN